MIALRRAVTSRLIRWSARRHGSDTLPFQIGRRRIYIVPTRFGIALASLLAAMLLAGLNYNSNLGLAFGFLMTSLALVAMHHCHRNLLGLWVDAAGESDTIAGGTARVGFVLRNEAGVERCDIEILCGGGTTSVSVAAVDHVTAALEIGAPVRGINRHPQFELRTRHPLGWFRAWTYVRSPLTIFVAPAPAGTAVIPPGSGAQGAAAQSARSGDEDFVGLRTYEPGVPLKHMAWKVLARGGEPAVRSYGGPAARPEWLDWTLLESLDVEPRLSQLCQWVMTSEATGRPYGLRIPGVEIAPGLGASHRRACLRALAGHGKSTT